jgi:hypothetical protein
MSCTSASPGSCRLLVEGELDSAVARPALGVALPTDGVRLDGLVEGPPLGGVIGELGQATWEAYVEAPWRDLLTPQVYWRDEAELVVVDDYAHLHRAETLPWRIARKADLPFIVHSLRDLAEEYAAARLAYHADQARIAIAYSHVATASLRGYATVARELGSEHWMPVVTLAESALRARRHDVAATVFDAADQPGAHRDHLRPRRATLLDA